MGPRLLVVNFAMDRASPVLAWQESVVQALADRCEHVVVLTEHVGDHRVAPNVEVHAVPAAFCRLPLRPCGAKWLMLAPVWRWCARARVDACFVHMNHTWAYRLWPVLRLRGIPTAAWYAHGHTSWRLRLSTAAASGMLTSSPEGLRLASPKVRVIGQAIDTTLFRPPEDAGGPKRDVVYVGRVAPRKRVDRLVEAMAVVRRLAPGLPLRLRVVGPTLPGDEGYAAALRARAAELGLDDAVEWTGPLARAETAGLYRSAFVHLNVSATGSMDKTVLEALACGCPVLTSNEAFRDLLAAWPAMRLEDDAPAAIARRILAAYRAPAGPPAALRELVAGRHDLEGWVERVLAALGAAAARRAA